MGKVNPLGIKQANKCMHLSVTAYNLKKYLKYMKNLPESIAGLLAFIKSIKNYLISLRILCFKPLAF
ncbi:hypothetical protein E9099_11865 [Psychroserpens sp. NJDZ02]|nr:hypothetical protein E9099_11865 [Psychroserpens sp. NJDZ02]